MADRKFALLAAAAVAAGIAALFVSRDAKASTGRGDNGDPDSPAIGAANMPTPLTASLQPSTSLVAWLKGKEGLSLKKYNLGDGGATIGYGHFEPSGPKADALPDEITQDQADQLFASDVQARGSDIVKAYVTVDLSQNEFDALTSLAFNLSRSAFSQIAMAVNSGQPLDPLIYTWTRPGTALEAGLRARRDAELAMFVSGTYA